MALIPIRDLPDYPDPTGAWSGDYFPVASVIGNPLTTSNLDTRKSTIGATIESYNIQVSNDRAAANPPDPIGYGPAPNPKVVKDTPLTVASFGEYVAPEGGLEWVNPCKNADGSIIPNCTTKPFLRLTSTETDMVLLIHVSSTGSDAGDRTVTKNVTPDPADYWGTPPTGIEINEPFLTYVGAYEWCFENIARHIELVFLIDTDIDWNDSATHPITRPSGDFEMRAFQSLSFYGFDNGGEINGNAPYDPVNSPYDPNTVQLNVYSWINDSGTVSVPIWFRRPEVFMSGIHFVYRFGGAATGSCTDLMRFSSSICTLIWTSFSISAMGSVSMGDGSSAIKAHENGTVYIRGNSKYDYRGAIGSLVGNMYGFAADSGGHLATGAPSVMKMFYWNATGAMWGTNESWRRINVLSYSTYGRFDVGASDGWNAQTFPANWYTQNGAENVLY